MFGYLIADTMHLTKDDRRNYRRFYCGLCDRLSDSYGNCGRKTLSYDLTFIHMFLSSVYGCENETWMQRCPLHPLKKHETLINPFSQYCADMNMLLSYCKFKDDYHDTGKTVYLRKMKQMEEYIDAIEKEYPRQSAVLKKQLDILNQIEKDSIFDPDLTSHVFGQIMAEIFSPLDEDELSEKLHAFGYHMGRFIYLMDAVVDFKDDLKNQNYNPLVQMNSAGFESMLMMVGEQCDTIYKTFDFTYGKPILDNIFYDGIWSKYRLAKSKERIFK